MAIIRPDQIQQLEKKISYKIPEGDMGARFTLSAMKDLVWSYECTQTHKAIIDRITADCQTDRCRIDKVYQWVTRMIKYTPDPPDEELIKSPCRIFNEVEAHGIATGDCDDQAILLATSFYLLGMQVGFEAVSNLLMAPGKAVPLDHVFAIVYDRDKQEWVGVDPVAPGKDWEGHKQMIELIGMAPPHYWIINALRNFWKTITAGVQKGVAA
jgi:hypothetical protein